MRTEAEIRNHIAALDHAMTVPCDCAATGHGVGCREGLVMMRVAKANLEWVLGADPVFVRNLLKRFAAEDPRRN